MFWQRFPYRLRPNKQTYTQQKKIKRAKITNQNTSSSLCRLGLYCTTLSILCFACIEPGNQPKAESRGSLWVTCEHVPWSMHSCNFINPLIFMCAFEYANFSINIFCCAFSPVVCWISQLQTSAPVLGKSPGRVFEQCLPFSGLNSDNKGMSALYQSSGSPPDSLFYFL